MEKAQHGLDFFDSLTGFEKPESLCQARNVVWPAGRQRRREEHHHRMYLGTKKTDSGTVTLLGQDPKKSRRSLFQKIGVQFQEGDYQQEIKVQELCEETACLYRNPADWQALCAQFGIGDKLKNPVKSLSGGERQRLFIVLALIPDPELVFLDELTTGLDAKARRGVWKTLEKLKDQGLTIFLTSHFMDEVEALCDEICILKKGRPVFYGTVEQAKSQCGCRRFEDAYLMLSD